MAAKSPAERRANARIAAHASWARTPIRSERTEPARRASPGRVEYWLRQVDPEGIMSPTDRRAAAENALRAYMGRLSKRGKSAREGGVADAGESA